MKIIKTIALFLLIAFIAIQFIPTVYNQSDIIPKTDFVMVKKPPKNVSKILKQSCYDCHSNNTEYPWYSKIQPAAWFLEDHIKKGKSELNFNKWNDLSNRRKNSKLKSIINQIDKDEMPLDSYTLIHRDAILSKSEKDLVTNYMKQIKDNL